MVFEIGRRFAKHETTCSVKAIDLSYCKLATKHSVSEIEISLRLLHQALSLANHFLVLLGVIIQILRRRFLVQHSRSLYLLLSLRTNLSRPVLDEGRG